MRFRPRRFLAIALLLGVGATIYVSTQPRGRRQPQMFSAITSRFQKKPVVVINPAAIAQAPVLNPERFTASPGDPNVLRDYDPLTPIPQIGSVTVRGTLDEATDGSTIEDCPTNTDLYAVAESTSYQIQVCSAEGNPQLPKYFVAQAQDGSGTVRITNEEVDSARQLIFKGDRDWYSLYRDSAHPEITNAYLEIYTPDGRTYAEALLSIHEREYSTSP
ncbi:MAG: hypothetical protein IGR76_03135 [Synechococcales cyanobacterium T60_A2020_003]|nr:hypothetical protein [Synechococcales cyanobacterium T60_A2020_003]